MAKIQTQAYLVTEKSDLTYSGKVATRGSVVTDIPGSSISFLLRDGFIVPAPAPAPETAPEPAPITPAPAPEVVVETADGKEYRVPEADLSPASAPADTSTAGA